MMWLIKFYDNWSDEMDMEGFTVLNYSDYIEYMSLLCDTARMIDSGKVFELYFGTNEWNEYTSGEEFIRCFSAEAINSIEAESLKRLLLDGCEKYGQFPSGSELAYFISRENGVY